MRSGNARTWDDFSFSTREPYTVANLANALEEGSDPSHDAGYCERTQPTRNASCSRENNAASFGLVGQFIVFFVRVPFEHRGSSEAGTVFMTP